MLPKRSRLTASEVREILKAGRSARLGTLSAKYVMGTGAKAAVVVSSKVAKSAVQRNALRRAAYQTLTASLPKNIRAVFFLHQNAFDPEALRTLCSKLS